MKVQLFGALLLLFLNSCEYPETESEFPKRSPKESQWVYLRAETIMKLDTSDYFLYGQVSKDFITAMDDEDRPKTFQLRNIRFFDDSDKLIILRDEDVAGASIFRTSDIVKMDLLERDPIFFTDSADLSEEALQFRKENQ